MLISICLIVYNQEEFIAQAIESVLAQQVSIPYEIVIGEDHSTDNTRTILDKYAQNHPDKIRLLERATNLGMHRNFAETLRACRGDYIAVLEGDDYWVDTHKLARQAALLDANPELSACFTRTGFHVNDDPTPQHYIPGRSGKPQYETSDLIAKNYIATCSMMFRNVVKQIDFERLQSLAMIDWPLWLLISQFGPIGYIDDLMAAYRYHDSGVWSGRDQVRKLADQLKAYQLMKTIMSSEYSLQFDWQIVKLQQHLATALFQVGNQRAGYQQLFSSIRTIPLQELPTFKTYLKQAAKLLLWSVRPVS